MVFQFPLERDNMKFSVELDGIKIAEKTSKNCLKKSCVSKEAFTSIQHESDSAELETVFDLSTQHLDTTLVAYSPLTLEQYCFSKEKVKPETSTNKERAKDVILEYDSLNIW